MRSSLTSYTVLFWIRFSILDLNRSQEAASLLWDNLKVHCRVNKSPPRDPVIRRINPFRVLTSCLFKIHSNFALPSMSTSSKFYPSNVLLKLAVFPTRAKLSVYRLHNYEAETRTLRTDLHERAFSETRLQQFLFAIMFCLKRSILVAHARLVTQR
jgi:hypothetical protein